MISLIKKSISLLPSDVQILIRKLWGELKYFGSARMCPVCERSSKCFIEFGKPAREDACCPRCFSLERDRLVWLFLKQKSDFFTSPPNRKMLHVAPEAIFQEKFHSVVGEGYITADLNRPDVTIKMDITDIDFPDGQFDIIYCSHVLEHVIDDGIAMGEFYRVLKSNGWAILNVPVIAGSTYEDDSITDPEERERAFGQWDHVRSYGKDYIERLRSAGFCVEKLEVCDLVGQEKAHLYGLTSAAGEIYYCRK